MVEQVGGRAWRGSRTDYDGRDTPSSFDGGVIAIVAPVRLRTGFAGFVEHDYHQGTSESFRYDQRIDIVLQPAINFFQRPMITAFSQAMGFGIIMAVVV